MAEARLWSSAAGPRCPSLPLSRLPPEGLVTPGHPCAETIEITCPDAGELSGPSGSRDGYFFRPLFLLGRSPLMSHPVVHLIKLFAVP